MTFSEFPTEADLEDFTEATADEDEEEEEEEGEEVVEDRDYYYDSFRGDDYNEQSPTEPGSDGAAAEEEITHDVRGRPAWQSRLQSVNILSFTYRLLASQVGPRKAASCPKGEVSSGCSQVWQQIDGVRKL